jgi:uncharacterized protein YdeI (YjbR/CyaY-like superfamily)
MIPAPASDIAEALRSNTAALSAFEALPPSHKREYLSWIDEAKQAATRQRRIAGMIDKLTERGAGVPEAVGRMSPLGIARAERGAD